MIFFKINNVVVFDTPVNEIKNSLEELRELNSYLKNKLLFFMNSNFSTVDEQHNLFHEINSIIEELENNAATIRLLEIADANPEDIEELEV